jgi:hypothetical protein
MRIVTAVTANATDDRIIAVNHWRLYALDFGLPGSRVPSEVAMMSDMMGDIPPQTPATKRKNCNWTGSLSMRMRVPPKPNTITMATIDSVMPAILTPCAASICTSDIVTFVDNKKIFRGRGRERALKQFLDISQPGVTMKCIADVMATRLKQLEHVDDLDADVCGRIRRGLSRYPIVQDFRAAWDLAKTREFVAYRIPIRDAAMRYKLHPSALGDVILAAQNVGDENATVDFAFGCMLRQRIALRPMELVPVLDGTPVPILADMPPGIAVVEPDAQVDLIIGILDNAPAMHARGAIIELAPDAMYACIWRRGVRHINSFTKRHDPVVRAALRSKAVRLAPCFVPFWEIAIKQPRVTPILKELIQRAWHPTRFMQWCLTTDEVERWNQTTLPHTRR